MSKPNYRQAVSNIAAAASLTFFVVGSIAFILWDRNAPQSTGSIITSMLLALVVGGGAFLLMILACALIYLRHFDKE